MTDAEQMVELLTYANYAKVGAALGVSRNAVSEWARGNDVTPYRVRQVRDLLRPPSASDGSEPQWARALLHQMAQIADTQKEAAPQIEERLDAIMTRDEVQKLVSEVEGRVTATIEGGVTARADAIVDHVVDRMVEELLKRAPQPVAADVQPQSD